MREEVEQVVTQPHLLSDVAVNRLQRARRQARPGCRDGAGLRPAEDRLQRVRSS